MCVGTHGETQTSTRPLAHANTAHRGLTRPVGIVTSLRAPPRTWTSSSCAASVAAGSRSRAAPARCYHRATPAAADRGRVPWPARRRRCPAPAAGAPRGVPMPVSPSRCRSRADPRRLPPARAAPEKSARHAASPAQEQGHERSGARAGGERVHARTHTWPQPCTPTGSCNSHRSHGNSLAKRRSCART